MREELWAYGAELPLGFDFVIVVRARAVEKKWADMSSDICTNAMRSSLLY